MALADILKLLDDEARERVDATLLDAHAQAEQLVSGAKTEAAALQESRLKSARDQAAEKVAGARVKARLEQRDRLLSRRRAHVDEASKRVVEALRKLPASEYSSMVVRHVTADLRNGEVVRIARSEPNELAQLLRDEVARRGLECPIEIDSDSRLDEGVLVQGGRMSFIVSASTIVDSARDKVEQRLVQELFDEGGQ